MRSPRCLVVVAGALCTAHALGQVVITPVLVQGMPAPGATGVFYAAQSPACQAFGRAAVYCTLTSTPNPGFDNSGLWQGGFAGVVPIAVQGTSPAGFGGRLVYGQPASPVQNRHGNVVFPQRFDPPFVDDQALIYGGSGALVIAFHEGDPAPGIPGALFGEVFFSGTPEYALNDTGRLAVVAPLTGAPAPGNRALFVGDAATHTYTLVARQGDPSPTPGAAPYSFITAPAINTRGDVAFFSNLSAAPFASLFVKPASGALQPVLSTGDPAPGFAPGLIITFLIGQNSGPPHMNDQGEFVVSGGVGTTGSGTTTAGLWRGVPGALQLIAKVNDPAPGAPNGVLFRTGFSGLINRSGAVMFASELSAGSFFSGFWIAPAGQTPRLLAFLGDQAPDMPPGVLITSTSNGGIALNNRGEGLIRGSLNYAVSSTPASGIFAGRAGRLHKVVASGDSLEIAPGVFRTALEVFCWTGNSPDTGRLTSINDRGEVAFSASFVGGGGGMFIAQLPDPCPGDTTGDDVVNFADLNAILSQFGLSGPGLSGDTNGDGVVNFADLNVVLSQFGQTCP